MPATQMCYGRDFLTAVVIKVDFPTTPLTLTEEKNPFLDKVSERFPHLSAAPLREMMFNFADGVSDVVHRDFGFAWTALKSPGGTVSLALGHDALTLTYGPSDYVGFDAFFEEFSFILDALVDNFGMRHFTRVGLRYVNEIRLPGRALDWAGIIDERLVSATLAPALNGGRLLRSMHQVCEQHDEDQVLLNYGLVNPDYPAPLVQRHFILDIDSFRQSVITVDETKNCIKRLNNLCTDTFENSIGSDLRSLMEPENE
ncbi:TIGR04255 family protein [Duganella sp. FT135W]|uniref:TIGR04255 family protein n=1 Tax=Duganella flavida TaxID=2692175 RepID=A0A6L8KG78_9BURK|nr:TIGR04255 family protein [Duganella flavida]MYM24834.1 TIGR04255 family protein [Duganella flavida]